MKKSARMGELAAQMAVALNGQPEREQESLPDSLPSEKHKKIKTDLINNKRVNTTAADAHESGAIGDIALNPPHGEKDGFERMSITLPPEIRQRLLDESNRRKKERSPD
ncbi:MAG: hypothetical protein M3Y27_17745, partial [Acidobacteriota bacterium]|nr:hypothetical protein [Acidobacteriota bacterium]